MPLPLPTSFTLVCVCVCVCLTEPPFLLRSRSYHSKEEEHHRRQPQGLGVSGGDFGIATMQDTGYQAEDSVAMGQPSYETFSSLNHSNLSHNLPQSHTSLGQSNKEDAYKP